MTSSFPKPRESALAVFPAGWTESQEGRKSGKGPGPRAQRGPRSQEGAGTASPFSGLPQAPLCLEGLGPRAEEGARGTGTEPQEDELGARYCGSGLSSSRGAGGRVSEFTAPRQGEAAWDGPWAGGGGCRRAQGGSSCPDFPSRPQAPLPEIPRLPSEAWNSPPPPPAPRLPDSLVPCPGLRALLLPTPHSPEPSTPLLTPPPIPPPDTRPAAGTQTHPVPGPRREPPPGSTLPTVPGMSRHLLFLLPLGQGGGSIVHRGEITS